MASRKSFAAGIGRKAIVRSTIDSLVIFFDNIETFQLVTLTAKSRRARDQLDHIPRLVVKYKQAILAASYEGTFARATSAVRVTSANQLDDLNLRSRLEPKMRKRARLE